MIHTIGIPFGYDAQTLREVKIVTFPHFIEEFCLLKHKGMSTPSTNAIDAIAAIELRRNMASGIYYVQTYI